MLIVKKITEFQILVWRSIRGCNMGSHRGPAKQWKFQHQQNSLQLCAWFSYTVWLCTWKPSCVRLYLLIWRRQQQRRLHPCKHRCLSSCSSKSLQLCLLSGKGNYYYNFSSLSFSFSCYTLECPFWIFVFAVFIFVAAFVGFYVEWYDLCTLCRRDRKRRMLTLSSGFSTFWFPYAWLIKDELCCWINVLLILNPN